MRMKRAALFVLMAALLCLPVWAMAEITVKDEDGNLVGTYVDGAGPIPITANNTTISGSATGVYLEVDNSVTQLTLSDVTITAPQKMNALKAASDLTLKMEGKKNTLTGGEGPAGYYAADAILVDGGLTINGTKNASLIANGGKGTESGGCGIWALTLNIQGNVIAQGGDATVLQLGSAGCGIVAAEGMKILPGSNVTATAGTGDLLNSGIYIGGGQLQIEDSIVSANGGNASGILFEFGGEINVKGSSQVTAQGSLGAVVAYDNSGSVVAATVQADGLVMKAGANAAAAALVENYEGNPPPAYLYISPAVQAAVAVPGEANVPTTGDEARLLLWVALASVSLLGMAMYARKRKEA